MILFAAPRSLWWHRAHSLFGLASRPGFWARLLPAVAVYALTVYALATVPTLHGPEGLPAAEAAYFALRFFAIDGDAFYPRSQSAAENALMWFVLFAAPAIAASAIFEVFLVFRRAVASPHTRAAAMERPVIVCGLGTHGRIVVEHAIANAREVVVIDLDVAESETMVVDGELVPVLRGDFMQPSVLRQAGAERAEMIWFCGGDPLTNLKGAVIARESVPPERPGTRALVPMVDDDLAEELLIECVGRRGIVEFRQFGTAACHLVNSARVRRTLARIAAGTEGRVSIVGFGRFGRATLRELGEAWSKLGNTRTLSVEVIDPTSAARIAAMTQRCAEQTLHLYAGDEIDGERWSSTARRNPPMLVFFCTADDSLNLRCAANLLERNGRAPTGRPTADIEVVLRMTSPLHEGEQQVANITMHSVAALLRAEVARTFAEADRLS